jgi:uncharacterized protein YlxW (UPF0749 family)
MGAKKELKKLKRKVNVLHQTVEEYSAKVDKQQTEVESLLSDFSLKITGLLQANPKAPSVVVPSVKQKVKKKK